MQARRARLLVDITEMLSQADGERCDPADRSDADAAARAFDAGLLVVLRRHVGALQRDGGQRMVGRSGRQASKTQAEWVLVELDRRSGGGEFCGEDFGLQTTDG
jgi:hypothetical protein